MKQIRNYFKDWGTTRIIRIILAVLLGIAYYYNRETIYLFGGIILTIQATFNITCPGGSCQTNYRKKTEIIVKTEKYEPYK